MASYNPGYQNLTKSLKPSTRQRFLALDFDYPAGGGGGRDRRGRERPCRRSAAGRSILLAPRLRALGDVDLEEGCSTRLVVYAATLIAGGLKVDDAVRAAMIEPLTDDVETRKGLLGTRGRDARLREPMRSLLGLLEPEEFVGKLWHRATASAVRPRFPEAASTLEERAAAVGVLFRGLGGPPAHAIAASGARGAGEIAQAGANGCPARRPSLVSRRDSQALYLPAVVDLWPDVADNRALHLWLAAFFVHLPLRPPRAPSVHSGHRLPARRGRARQNERWPRPRDFALTPACAKRSCPRGSARRLPPAEAAVERAVRALLTRGRARIRARVRIGASSVAPPRAYRPFAPVPLWGEAIDTAPGKAPAEARAEPPASSAQGGGVARKARRENQDQTQRQDYMALNRFEKMLTLAQSMNLARPVEDDDEEGAKHAAENSDEIVLSPHREAAATRLKLELELSPAAAPDGGPAAEGLRYPEWDWRRRAYRKDACRVVVTPLRSADAEWTPSPEALRRVRRVHRQFEAFRPRRKQARAQVDGDELDLDAVVRARADCAAGGAGSDRIYLAQRNERRDVAIALLIDASLSTDAHLGARRVIDVARETALIFCHALDAAGDPHAVWASPRKAAATYGSRWSRRSRRPCRLSSRAASAP